MATALLIVGYLLFLGPLILIARVWRNRTWLGYLAQLLGTLLVGAGWFLQGVPQAAFAHGLWLFGFGVAFPLHAGRSRPLWKVVATGLVAAATLGGAGYLVARSQFKKTKVDKADRGQAFSDFRKTQGALKASKGVPAAGVYTYNASGHYTVSVSGLGLDKRVLPETIPAILTAKDRCWTLNLRFFKQHHRTVHYCLDADGSLRMKWLVNKNEFFGFKHLTRSRCEPDLIYRPGLKAGHVSRQTCRPQKEQKVFGKANAKATFTYLATETITVGGQKIRVHHHRRNLAVKSMQSANVEQHVWFAVHNGLLVRYKVNGKGWGLATFKSDFQVTLKSLTPKR